jgi:hypothetical protein
MKITYVPIDPAAVKAQKKFFIDLRDTIIADADKFDKADKAARSAENLARQAARDAAKTAKDAENEASKAERQAQKQALKDRITEKQRQSLTPRDFKNDKINDPFADTPKDERIK